MSDDRELLELAAKAAGIQIKRCRLNDPVWRDMLLMIRAADDNAIGWNPLTDDGDALRLAIKCNMAITVSNHETHCEGPRGEYAYQKHASDANAATRLVIVLCAAEIAKSMP